MPLESLFRSINLRAPPASPLPSSFTLAAPSDTDIWKTRPRGAVFTGPVHYISIPISSFRSAHVTLSGHLSNLYDQGGLLLALPSASATLPARWIKLGIERIQTGSAQLSCVACDRYADWSLQQLPEDTSSVTVAFERKAGSDALWAYWVTNGEKKPVREVTWALIDEEDGIGNVWVGVYAARPAKVETDLQFNFSDFAVEDENGWVIGESNEVKGNKEEKSSNEA